MKLQKLLYYIVIAVFLQSCASKKDILLLQDLPKNTERQITKTYISTLQPDDILSIVVSTKDNAGVQPFNLTTAVEEVGAESLAAKEKNINYIIRPDGTIEFPVLGKVKVAGLTTIEVSELFKQKLKAYLKEPMVVVEWLNFKYSVLGEVSRPGMFKNPTQRITILEALANAGDLTIYANRKDVLLIRENNGTQQYINVDLTNKSFLESESYYLKQNDVLIVSPNGTQIQESVYNKNASLYVSVASIVLSIIILIAK